MFYFQLHVSVVLWSPAGETLLSFPFVLVMALSMIEVAVVKDEEVVW